MRRGLEGTQAEHSIICFRTIGPPKDRELMDMEMGSCKVAPTIAGFTNETKKVPDKIYAPTIADSTNETKNAEVCAIANTTSETIKVPDNVYVEVRAILAALPTLADAVLLAQDRLREQDRAPIRYDYEENEFSLEGFKCYYQSKNRDPTCTDNKTILGPRNCGPSLVMNILFISGPESREKSVLEKIMYIFLHNSECQKFLDKIGFGHEYGFDGDLLLPEAAGFDFWFEPR
jgi:hypothetical protein